MACFLEWQADKTRQSVLENPNTHYVQVVGKFSESGLDAVKFEDVPEIQRLAAESSPSSVVSAVYSLPFGIPVNGEEATVFVRGVEADGSGLFGTSEPEDGFLYSTAYEKGIIELDVPIVDAEEGGFSSGATIGMSLETRPLDAASPILALGGSGPGNLVFVNEATFGSVFGAVFGVEWNEVASLYDSTNPFGFELVESIFVWVDRLEDVRDVAASLESQDYQTGYALRSFPSLLSAISVGGVATIVLAVAIVLSGLALALSSYRSYFRLSRRDMGIGVHLGYSRERIQRFYAAAVARNLGWAAATAVAADLAVGLVLLRQVPLAIVANAVGACVLLACVYGWVVWWDLRRTVRLPVIDLVKLGRDFE
jgi:hypothetical protein